MTGTCYDDARVLCTADHDVKGWPCNLRASALRCMHAQYMQSRSSAQVRSKAPSIFARIAMEVVLDDIGAEVEVNPDEVEVVKQKKPRKTRLLKKDEKKALLDMLSSLASDCSSVVAAVIDIVTNENHIHVYKERETFWTSLQSAQSLISTLVKGLTELFIRVYKSCQTGKDKYCKFQLEWHRQCSVLLMDLVDEGGHKDLCQIHQRWLGYCEGSGVAKDVFNPVLIAVYSAVFDYLMQRVALHQKREQSDDLDQTPTLEDQEVGVYYRFGGAALAAMLHLRYDQLNPGIDESKRECVRDEITILKAIQCTTKDHVPDYLQYRDMGYMYFPAACYIPFIKNVDKCVSEYANESSLKQHGSRLVEVATENLRNNNDLETQFISVLKDIYLDYSQNGETVHRVFLEFTRKLCNTRIQEFLDVHRQVAAKGDGKSTLSGQNLRDKLLTYHTKSN